MNARLTWGLVFGCVISVLSGCSSSPGIIRGQTPPEALGITRKAHHQHYDGAWPQYSYSARSFQHGQHASSVHGRIDTDPGAQAACGPNGQCSNGSNCNGGDADDCYPTHRHWYNYDPPNGGGHFHHGHGLVYPPANVPGAVVVYPYYTLKGPDDFFLQ